MSPKDIVTDMLRASDTGDLRRFRERLHPDTVGAADFAGHHRRGPGDIGSR